MSNLSQIKRQRMLQFLNKIREEHSDDESLMAINEIENELVSKKYGLVWEEHEERVDIKMRTHIPVFSEVKEREIISNEKLPYNFILEGDNLHSLKLLEKTHKEKIDLIYIDPPYNTEHSLIYNDKRIGENDSFKHSKWLSFMSVRLKIARNLLIQSGVIFISIDDNENCQLRLLCNEIFGERNFIGEFCVIKAEGGGIAKQVVKGHDTLYAYAKNIENFIPLAKEKDIRGRVTIIDGIKYWIQEDAIRKEFGKYGNLHYEEILEYKDENFKNKIDKKINEGKYILIQKENGLHVIGVLRKIEEDSSKFYSVLKHLNANGVLTLKEMGLSNKFSYPKPVSLIKELIKGATFFAKKNFIILDFFAGSGTTAQAVLELNKEDGKNRTFILCTDNSVEEKMEKELKRRNLQQGDIEWEINGICQSCTYPRILNIIKGYTSIIPTQEIVYRKKITINNLKNAEEMLSKAVEKAKKLNYDNYKLKIDKDNYLCLLVENKKNLKKYEKISANLKYYQTDFIPKESINENYNVNEELLKHIREMVQLEYAVNLDGKNYILIMCDDDADKVFSDEKLLNGCNALYISAQVLLTIEQQKQILEKGISVFFIPDYYFESELIEAGER